MSLERMRIFISSPGDVAEERVLANNLVRRLSDEFAQRLWIEPVFWEHEPLLATETFQSQIPPPHECEVAVCILWSRLGTRLPANITRADGSRYGSGTEYEFEDAAEGFHKNGYPQLLVYRKTAEPLMSLQDEQALLQRLGQKKALDQFVQKWFFHAEDGTLKAAFHSFANAAEFEQALEEHLRKLIARRLENLPATSGDAAPGKISWTSGSPFRGLDVFDFQHAPIFFGRTQAIGDVLSALRQNAATGRAFVLVVGVSGGGKSSLVRAGVLPVLTQPGVIEGVGLWRRAVLKPSDGGGNLMQGVALALLAKEALPELSSDGTTPTQLAEQLKQNPTAASMLIKGGLSQAAAKFAAEQKLSQQPDGRLVLVVDQLEEFFTLPNLTPPDRQAFVALLSSLARSGKVFIIATLRGDFYHRCFELPELGTLKEGAGHYDLPLPSAAEIAQMIRQPARAAGLAFEEDPQTRVPLDEVLREAASRSPESLPLLEFALEEIYRRKTPQGLLTYAAYRDLGGVEGALAQRAEAVFDGLEPAVQATLPRVMRALVSVGDGEALARQQATMESVASTPQAHAFVEAFVQARFFTADRTEAGQALVRVTHEALLRNWPRIKQWLEQDRELLIVRGRVSVGAGRWQKEGRRSDLLLSAGKPLAEAENLLAKLGSELPEIERAFIAASQAQRMRLTLLKRAAIAALVLLAVAASLAAGYARHQRALADKNEQTARQNADAAQRNAHEARVRLAEGLVAQGDALLLAGRFSQARVDFNEAWDAFDHLGLSHLPAQLGVFELDRHSSLCMATMLGHTAPVSAVAYSPDGKTALSGDREGTMRLWDLSSGRQLRLFDKPAVSNLNIPSLLSIPLHVLSVAFSPDGHTALSGSSDNTLSLWDVETGRELHRFEGHTGPVRCVVFSPDGRTALSASDDTTIRLWDLNSGRELKQFNGHNREAFCVAFSPDGHTALSGGGDNTMRLWDVNSGREVRRFEVPPVLFPMTSCACVAFSPDGLTALSSGTTNVIRLWDVNSGHIVRSFEGPQDSIRAVAFCPNGCSALSTNLNGTLILWDLVTGLQVRRFEGHAGPVLALAIAPNGRSALSGSDDTTLRHWDLDPGRELLRFEGHTGSVSSVAFSPDGRVAISGSDDRTLRLWDLGSRRELRRFEGHADLVRCVAFSPDGHTVLSGSNDKTMRLWDLETGRELRKFEGHTGGVISVAFGPDGCTVLSSSEDKTVRLWNVVSGRELRRMNGHTDFVTSVIFSPDGLTALSGSGDNTLRLWNLNSGREVRRIEGHTTHAPSQNNSKIQNPHETAVEVHLAFSPDGRTVISGSDDNSVRLWDIETGRELRQFKGHTSYVRSVAFSPDGHSILSGGSDKTIRLWDVDSGRELRQFTGHEKTVRSVAFSPNGKSVLSGSMDNTLALWNFDYPVRQREWMPRAEAAKKALADHPDDAAALGVLGDWYAFLGLDQQAIDLLERARAGGVAVSPLTLGRCYWEFGDLPHAQREYTTALAATQDAQEKFYLQLCLSAIQAATTQSATPTTKPE